MFASSPPVHADYVLCLDRARHTWSLWLIGLALDHLDLRSSSLHLAQPHRQHRCLFLSYLLYFDTTGCINTYYPYHSMHLNWHRGPLC